MKHSNQEINGISFKDEGGIFEHLVSFLKIQHQLNDKFMISSFFSSNNWSPAFSPSIPWT